MIYGVETSSYYGNSKYFKTVFQSYNSNGEYVPLPTLLLDYYEPDKCIGLVYTATTGKKKIVRYDEKRNKFIVRSEISGNELYKYFLFINLISNRDFETFQFEKFE